MRVAERPRPSFRASGSGPTPNPGAGGFVVLGRSRLQGCILASPWSHLWSHSCRFRGVRSELRRLGSGAAGPNRTSLIHQPQNSKAALVFARVSRDLSRRNEGMFDWALSGASYQGP
jgi:hypothetical protein